MRHVQAMPVRRKSQKPSAHHRVSVQPPACRVRTTARRQSIEMRIERSAPKKKRDNALTTGFGKMNAITMPRETEPIATEMIVARWEFSVGQCVTGKECIMPALVLARCKVQGGSGEAYRIRPYSKSGPWKDLTISGAALRDAIPGSMDCGECLLAATGICPGSKR